MYLRKQKISGLENESAFLWGARQTGKSTLLKLMALIGRPTRGSILINDSNTAKIGRWRVPWFRREIGIVFQNNRLLMDRTVFDNVALPLVVSGVHHRELGRRVRAALDKVGLLNRDVHRVRVVGGYTIALIGTGDRYGVCDRLSGRTRVNSSVEGQSSRSSVRKRTR